MTIFSEVRVGAGEHIEKTPLARRKQWWGWLFISPWLIGLLAFTILPMLASLVFSFTEFNLNDARNIKFNGINNYLDLLKDPNVGISLGVTLRFAVLALPLSVVLPIGLAALLNSEYLLGKRFFRTAFYAPYMVPVVSAAYIWSGVLNTETGWINRFLESIGIAGPNWLFSVDWIYPAFVIVGLWGVGNAMLITLSSMQGVPTEYYEAAKVDGAGGLRRFRHITLPLISPVIFYNLVLSVIGLFRYFEIPFILKEGTGDPGNSTLFYNIHLYKTAFTFQDMGYGSTLAWFLFLIAFLVTVFLFWSAKYWVYYASGD
jgi:multiple sugar transport system permease protein